MDARLICERCGERGHAGDVCARRAPEGIEIIIRGAPDRGKTTIAYILQELLREAGYCDVTVQDVAPLPAEMKGRWWDRFQKAQCRPVRIRVEVVK